MLYFCNLYKKKDYAYKFEFIYSTLAYWFCID